MLSSMYKAAGSRFKVQKSYLTTYMHTPTKLKLIPSDLIPHLTRQQQQSQPQPQRETARTTV